MSKAFNRGRYTLLSFFFADCHACIYEVPALNSFSVSHPDIDVVSVTFDSVEVSNGFALEHQLVTDVVADAQPFIDSLGVSSFPTLMLIDPQGKLVAMKSGWSVSGEKSAAQEPNVIGNWVKEINEQAKVSG